MSGFVELVKSRIYHEEHEGHEEKIFLKPSGNEMRIFTIILGLLLVSAGLCGTVQADSLEAFRAAAETVTSIQADFIQEKHLAILVRPLTASGRFLYRATPASLRWEYTEPVRSLLLMENGEVRKFMESDNGELTEDTAAAQYMNVAMGEISKWMTGRFDDTGMFDATLSAGEDRIILTPREAAFRSFIARIELVPADQPGVMDQVVIYESEDSFTRFRFINTVLNTPLSDDLFKAAQ